MKIFVSDPIFSSVKKFDEFAREMLHKTLSSLALPEEDNCTLFDFGIDCKLGRFLTWGEMSQEKTRHSSQNLFVLVPEVIETNPIQILCNFDSIIDSEHISKTSYLLRSAPSPALVKEKDV